MPVWPRILQSGNRRASAASASASATPRLTRRLCVHRGTNRSFSIHSHETVDVRCGSSGFVSVDLFNVQHYPSSAPLLVHLPSAAAGHDAKASLPGCLQSWPVASINYRWKSSSVGNEPGSSDVSSWPAPVHDTAFAYAWLVDNLAPSNNGRRDIYVYGSHLGGGLAMSLALTEAHAHTRFGVRGVIAYNGIYNWTMFLPDHRINKPVKRTRTTISPPEPAAGSRIDQLRGMLPTLFDEPVDLFDPYASPNLFFHGPGLLIPRSFGMTAAEAALVDAMTRQDRVPLNTLKAPRKSHLIFPPRKSTLKIPETLLLHDSPALAVAKATTGRTRRRVKARGNTFQTQAEELAELMRRSIDKVELKERSLWDEEIDGLRNESKRRVQVLDMGEEVEDPQLPEFGQDATMRWLEARLAS